MKRNSIVTTPHECPTSRVRVVGSRVLATTDVAGESVGSSESQLHDHAREKEASVVTGPTKPSEVSSWLSGVAASVPIAMYLGL